MRSSAGNALARYEQTQVLEKQVLNPWNVEGQINRRVLGASQTLAEHAWGRALGAQKPEVRLTSGCTDGTPPVPFAGDFLDDEKRVAYYTSELVPAFRRLDPGRRAAVIGRLARGGAGAPP